VRDAQFEGKVFADDRPVLFPLWKLKKREDGAKGDKTGHTPAILRSSSVKIRVNA